MPMDFLSRKRYDYKASAITACTFLVYVRETSIMSTRIAFSPMARAGRVKSSDNDNRAKALFRSRSTGNNERRIVDPSRPSQADPFFFYSLCYPGLVFTFHCENSTVTGSGVSGFVVRDAKCWIVTLCEVLRLKTNVDKIRWQWMMDLRRENLAGEFEGSKRNVRLETCEGDVERWR